MKIAITGGTAGIGQALGNLYEQEGHEVLRLSRRTGHNIRVTNKIAEVIEPCDVFVNNAQSGFAQTELLFEMSRRWSHSGKHIISIGSMMTMYPVCNLPGMSEYYIQKVALEAAIKELRQSRLGIRFTLVRPGDIATESYKTVPPSQDVVAWSQRLYDMLKDTGTLKVPEISLG